MLSSAKSSFTNFCFATETKENLKLSIACLTTPKSARRHSRLNSQQLDNGPSQEAICQPLVVSSRSALMVTSTPCGHYKELEQYSPQQDSCAAVQKTTGSSFTMYRSTNKCLMTLEIARRLFYGTVNLGARF